MCSNNTQKNQQPDTKIEPYGVAMLFLVVVLIVLFFVGNGILYIVLPPALFILVDVLIYFIMSSKTPVTGTYIFQI